MTETVIIEAPGLPPEIIEVGPRFSGTGKTTLSIADSPALPAINTDVHDVVKITGQMVNIQSFSANLTGSPEEGDSLRISITSTTNITITWGAFFERSLIGLPVIAIAGTRLDIGLFWNSDTSKWRCVGVS
jgi:hypothetical protein